MTRSVRTAALQLLVLLCFAPVLQAQQERGEELRRLQQRVQQLDVEGNYQEVLPLAVRAVELANSLYDAEHVEAARALFTLAQAHRRLGAYDRALQLYQRALAIREKVLGPEHGDTAEALGGLAACYRDLGEYGKAMPLQLRMLAILERALGPDDVATAAALEGLAELHQSSGELDKAEPLYVRALSIRERRQPGHPDLAHVLVSISALYMEISDYNQAEALAQRAITILENAVGPRHPRIAPAVNQLGRLYVGTGRSLRAAALFQRAMEIAEKTYGAESEQAAGYQCNLAITYFNASDYDKAGRWFQRALDIFIKVLGPEHPKTAILTNNLAALKHAIGALDEAVALYDQAMAINRAVYGEEHDSIADIYRGRAEALRAKGDFEQSARYFQRALALYRRNQTRDEYDVAKALAGFGMLRWKMQRPDAALVLLQRAQALYFSADQRLLLTGTESRSRDYLQAKAFEAARDVSFSVGAPSRDSTILGLTRVLNYKARVLDLSLDSAGRLRRSLKAEDRQLLEQLSEVASRLSVLTYAGAAQSTPRAVQQQFADLSRQQRRLEDRLSQRSVEFRRDAAPVTVAAVAAALPRGAALVEWFRYEPHDLQYHAAKDESLPPRYMAYVLRQGRVPVAIDLGSADVIEQLVQQFRIAVSSPQRTEVRERSAELAAQVLHPVLKHLEGVRHLIVSPDAILNLVPMAALLDERGRYLIERFELSHVTSGRDLIRIAGIEPLASSNAVVMANPDFGRRDRAAGMAAGPLQRSEELERGGLVFRELPGTGQEAASVARLLQQDDVRVLLRGQATEASLKRLHGPRILHVATHGFFLDDQERRRAELRVTALEDPMLRAGLALAGANARSSGFGEDGILTALEASHLDLRGTQLAVLSACETGVGEVSNAVGVVGLQRGFLLAGAQTLVTSLWGVADIATKELMVSFYEGLMADQGRSAALRNAQLKMLANPEYTHPYYWAAFLNIGAWTALPRQSL